MFFVNPIVIKLLDELRVTLLNSVQETKSNLYDAHPQKMNSNIANKLTALSKSDKIDEERIVFYLQFAPAVAGAASGFFANALLYPLETLKTRIQSTSGLSKSGGFKGLYRGALVYCLSTIPMNSFFLGCYETLKTSLTPYLGKDSLLVNMISASTSRVLLLTVRVPIEVAKQRRQMLIYAGENSGIMAIIKDAYHKEGIRGLYRGYTATLLRDVPYSLTELPLWEFLKNAVRKRTMSNEVTTLQSAYCGLLAGAVAAYLTTPFDMVKTRVMLAHPKRVLIKNVIRKEFMKGGVRGMFQGVYLRMFIIMINRFVFFGVYDTTKTIYGHILRRHMEGSEGSDKGT